jgi:hypothetical protein
MLGGVMGVLLLCLPLFSQGNTGRILGTVVDQSGGTVAGAAVTVVDADRGVTKNLVTNDAGEYNAPNLTPGNYKVRAEAKGFKTIERTSIVLEVGKEIRVDLSLSPGSVAETMTITETVPLVETTNATLGGTLNNADINDMPLNGRNYQSLLSLRPGVMLQPGGGPWTQSTNGVRPDESLWMIDGVINSNFFDARPIAGMPSPITDGATILPIDAIQEFNLMENPKAEYGWKPGAVVNVGIKSGTNTLHGSAYGFYRSAAWDARNYFNPAPSPDGSCPLSSCDKVATQLKQFGAVVGGPIKKDKLFFFGAYEGLRDLLGNSFGTPGIPETGPTNGDATNNMAAAINADVATLGAGAISPVSLALTGCTVGATPAATACTPPSFSFPSNPTNNVGYVSNFPNTNKSDNWVGKIDSHISSKNSLNGVLLIGRYLGDGEDRAFINKIFLNNYVIKTYTASGSWIYTPGSTLVNEVRVGYNRMSFITGSDDANVRGPVNTGLTVPGLPTIGVSGFGLLGTWHNRPQAISPNPYYDIQDSVSYLMGKHSLKFGGEFAHIEADSNIPDYGRGRINFEGGGAFNILITCPVTVPITPPPCFNTSTPLEDLFAGTPTSGKVFVGNANRRMLWTETAAFVQDDWRLAPKLTLNLGMRYEYKKPIREASNLWANFDPTSPTGLVQQGQGGLNTLWKPDPFGFSPRMGFAYDVTGKGTTVVRGGFSLMYSTFTAVEWMNQNQFQNSSAVSLAANPTGADIVTTANSGTSSAVTTTKPGLANGIQVKVANQTPTNTQWNGVVFPKLPGNIKCGDGLLSQDGVSNDPGPCALMAVDPNLRTPYLVNYNFGVQHSIGYNLSLEIGYVGNHGSRLTGYADINQKGFQADGKGPRPYAKQFPYFSFINQMTNDVRSNYNSMQATLTKRMSHGLSFIAGYTFAHGLDNGSLNRFALLPRDANNPGAEYGNSDFDVRHRLTFTTTYNIPGIKGFAQLLEGWQLNGIVTVQSAQPWTVNDYGNNFTGSGDSNGQWDFFGKPADFKGTLISIPWCSGFTVNLDGTANASGATCTTTNGLTSISTTVSNSSTLAGECATMAPDPTTLKKGGCFASGASVMAPPKAGTAGTMTRNIFRDSGYKNVDFSVFKNFTFKERYGVQMRAEVFNLFNKPIFSNPYGASNGSSSGNNDPASPASFGGAIGTPDIVAGSPVVSSGAARDVQVGLKLTF